METEALQSKVGENYLPFKKETRGKVWKPKPRRQTPATILPDDLSEALDGASVDEIAELAGVYHLFCCVNSSRIAIVSVKYQHQHEYHTFYSCGFYLEFLHLPRISPHGLIFLLYF